MAVADAVIIALLTASLFGLVIVALYEREIKQLERENQMFRRLLSDQASLHEMSLNAYIAMLREAQQYVGR
jgi:hypothetical protein